MTTKELDRNAISRRLQRRMNLKGTGTRELWRRVRADLGQNAPGASYGTIQGYTSGKVARPRLEVLKAMARALDVRHEWLAWGDGEPTEQQELRRREPRLGGIGRLAREDAELREIREAVKQAHLEVIPALVGNSEALGIVAAATGPPASHLLRQPKNYSQAEAMDAESRTGSSFERQKSICQGLGRETARALRAPADILGVDLNQLPAAQLTLYLSAAAHALRVLQHPDL